MIHRCTIIVVLNNLFKLRLVWRFTAQTEHFKWWTMVIHDHGEDIGLYKSTRQWTLTLSWRAMSCSVCHEPTIYIHAHQMQSPGCFNEWHSLYMELHLMTRELNVELHMAMGKLLSKSRSTVYQLDWRGNLAIFIPNHFPHDICSAWLKICSVQVVMTLV